MIILVRKSRSLTEIGKMTGSSWKVVASTNFNIFAENVLRAYVLEFPVNLFYLAKHDLGLETGFNGPAPGPM